MSRIRKAVFCIMWTGLTVLLSGCAIGHSDHYERIEFQSAETVSEVVIEDISTQITVKTTADEKVLVEYSDSPAEPWYSIDISDGVLKIKKTRGTIGVEDSTLIVSLPEKEYRNIFIQTTNGDIILNNTSALAYYCSTENDDIKGTINGTERDYSIQTEVKNGKSNIENNRFESLRTIEFHVKNGKVDIKFVQ